MTPSNDPAVAALFASGGANALAILDALFRAAGAQGPFEVEIKKTCLHMCHGPAFAGVHPRKTGLLVTLKSEAPIASPRVRKADIVSARRAYNDLLLSDPADIDAEFTGWLQGASALTAVKAG